MTKRVSVKGRGADLFFGDYEPEPPTLPHKAPAPATVTAVLDDDGPPPPTDDRPHREPVEMLPAVATTVAASPVHASEQATMPVSKNASKKARKPARIQVSTQESLTLADPATDAEPTGWAPDFIDEVLDVVAEPATVTNAFRYTDQELTELADVLYDVAKRFRVKVSKQDVARLGLTAVLREYQQRGEASLLGALVRRKRQRGRSDTP